MEQLTWGILMVAYLFIGGMAGGAYIIGALADIFAKGRDKCKVLSKSGIYVSLVSIILGLVFVVLDLGRFEVDPVGSLNVYLHFPTSIMSVGTWIITAFTVVSLLTAILWFFRGNELVRKIVEVVGIVLGGSTATYSGILLAFARGRPFWVTPYLPWVFFISGTLTGLALALFLIPIIAVFMPRFFEEFKELVDQRKEFAQMLTESQRYIVILIFIELALLIIELGTGHNTGILLTDPGLSPMFFGYVIAGLIAPLGIAYYIAKIESTGNETSIILFSLSSFVLVLIGGFLLRYVVLIAGQIIA